MNSKEVRGGPQRFAALDSWRGICACLVAITHAPIYSHIFFAPLIRNAWLFVDFFFVLSGFVLSHAYFHKLSNVRDALDFLIRRFGRLWPLHAVTASIFIGYEIFRIAGNIFLARTLQHVALAREPIIGTLSILANALLLQSMGPQQWFVGKFEWNFPSWSISVEFYTCVLFALVSAVGGKQKNRILLALCIVAAANYIFINFFSYEPWTPFCRGVFGFLTGHFVYWFYLRTKQSMPLATICEFVILAATLMFVSAATVSSRLWSVAPVVFGIAVFIFAREAGFISRLFKIPVARKLGE
jgi:peptidoglycan/LPS O-acetylase OafA/YrhL